METVKEVMSRKETAGYLGICLNTLAYLPIPQIRIGRSVKYRKLDINTWLEARAKEGAAQC
ncbi:helix-turn-helix MerR-family like proteins [Candidatus Termititenax persephonae]|uniref:Helix-turn-helix MerR-family like proteins n=1 Tax=Candidatus Termititenax persephonae TaxID=2218525 RepID=A0A388TGS0_9BACT|nr:helix-turn-helix MerR-family like proteins [Candidatus Termititenax persephonae]